MDSTPPIDSPTRPATDSGPAAIALADGVASAPETAEIETRVMGSASGLAKPGGVPHTLKVVRFENLACCGDEIWIENEGQLYRLRKTRQGKLILTK